MPIRVKKKESEKTGLLPGSLVFVGEEEYENPRIGVMNYDKNNNLPLKCQLSNFVFFINMKRLELLIFLISMVNG